MCDVEGVFVAERWRVWAFYYGGTIAAFLLWTLPLFLSCWARCVMNGRAKRGREWAICWSQIYCKRDLNSTALILACSYHSKAVLLKNLG